MKNVIEFTAWLIFHLLFALKIHLATGNTIGRLSLKGEPEDLLFLNTMPSKISCQADGYPKSSINWLDEKGSVVKPINGLRYLVNNELHFSAFEEKRYTKSVHFTKYRCRVSSTIGSIISKEIRVTAVMDTRYSPMVYHKSAPLNGFAIFTCYLPPDTTDYIKVLAWLVTYPGGAKKRSILSGMSIDGFNALTTGELVVDDVMKVHEEYKFSCVSQNILNNVTLISSSGRLFSNEPKKFKPINFVIPQNQTIYAGETITLNCHTSSYPLSTFMWYKDGARLELNDRVKVITGGSIKIIRSTVLDQGKYSCKITYETEEITFDVTVVVKVPLVITEMPKLVSTSSKKTATFSCKATGTKPMTREWRKDGTILQKSNRVSMTGDTLILSDVTTSEEGVYQCVIKNNFDQVQASARLIVDAVLPTILFLTQSETVQSRSLVTLVCKCEGEPSPEFTWLKDGKPVVVEKDGLSVSVRKEENNVITSFLTIRNIQTKFSATYTCVAENRVGKVSAGTVLRVEGTPNIIEFPSKVHGITGGTLNIDCKGKGYPPVSHKWYKNGIEMYSNDRTFLFPNGTMQLKRFDARDVGKYWCNVKNIYGLHQSEVSVVVLDPPQITPFSLTPTLVGKRAQYLCTSQGSDIGLDISWYKNGLEARKIEGVQIMDLTFSKALTFEKIMTSHRGRYTCVVKNKAGKASHSADLVVFEKPVLVMKPADTSVLHAHPVQLYCSATGFPIPQITWLKRATNGELTPVNLDHRVHQLNNGSLIITAAQASDNGRYVCQASFFDKKMIPDPLTIEISLVVRVPATIITTSPSVARNVKSQSIELFCATSGTPVLKLRWFKNGVIISEESTSKYFSYRTSSQETQPPTLNSSLQIKHLTQMDTGHYECMAINPFGSKKRRFEVYVEEKPNKPNSIQQISSASRSIRIKWNPGFDGNAPITLYRTEVKPVAQSWNTRRFTTLSGKTTEYLASELHPGSAYTFRVNAMNKHGISDWSEQVVLVTEEEAPSAPPKSVSVEAVANDKLYIKWEEPEAGKRNGIIISYRIFYTSSSVNHYISQQNVTTGNVQHFILRNLLQFTSYRVQVQAFTKVGGGPLSGVKIGITSEGVPSLPPPSVKVQSISSHQILVTWHKVPSSEVNGVLKGYKVIYTDIKRKKTYQKNVMNVLRTQLSGLYKFTMYKIGVLAYTEAGDGVTSEAMYKRTDEDVPDEPADFNVIPAGPSKIVITWSPPHHKNGILTYYVIYYNEISQDAAVSKVDIKPEDVSYALRDVTLGKKYSIWMTAKTSKGEGKSTKKITAQPTEHAPATIITHRHVMRSPLGSDVTLPCLAIGHPKPSLSWYKMDPSSSYRKQRRWLATDSPRRLFNIQREDAGQYNCTAVNAYGNDWNVVTLMVQVVPSAPENVSAKLIKQYLINVTWTSGSDGNSAIITHHVQYIISGKHKTWQSVEVPATQLWFVIANVTKLVAYFRVASENHVGIGEYYPPLKLVISGHGVNKFRATSVFTSTKDEDSNSLRSIIKPLLIAIVVLVTILIILLFIASWDRDECRMRKPKCNRLCFCTCRRKHNYNDDPYGEPGLLWPWNIKSNRHSGAFGVEDVLLGSSDDQLQFKYAPAYSAEENKTDSLRKKFGNTSRFGFEPVVLFTPSKLNSGRPYSDARKNRNSSDESLDQRNGIENISFPNCNVITSNVITSNGSINRQSFHRNGKLNNDYDEPSMIEKYLRSQEAFEPKNSEIKFTEKNNIISDDSTPPPLYLPGNNTVGGTKRGSADGVSDKHSPPGYNEITKQNNWITDVPRALLRGSSPTKRGRRGKNRKSLDSLILKALEDIEEKQVLANESIIDPKELEQHANNVLKELLTNPPRPYDSVSSTCSSSVGELRRAFDFGKKYGLQNYNLPSDISDSDEENDLDYQAHEKLLNQLDMANFSAMPRDSNDMKVRIPLPVRMEQLRQDGSSSAVEEESSDEQSSDGREQSLV